MDHAFITAPSQMNLISDFIFDVTGIPISAGELVVLATGFIAIRMIFNSPLFGRT